MENQGRPDIPPDIPSDIPTKILITCFILSAIAVPAYADIVWPALFLEARLLTWWAISLGLIVEYMFIRYFFSFNIKKSIIVTSVMNLASTVLGIILIPLAGIAWAFFFGIVLHKLFDIGTFNPGTWAATFVFAVVISAALESLVIAKCFKTKVGKRGLMGLILANTVSVAVAFGSLFIFPL